MYSKLDGLVQIKIGSSKNALVNKNRVLNSKCPEHFAGKESRKDTSAFYAENGKHT
jgi:hypothetical protein